MITWFINNSPYFYIIDQSKVLLNSVTIFLIEKYFLSELFWHIFGIVRKGGEREREEGRGEIIVMVTHTQTHTHTHTLNH